MKTDPGNTFPTLRKRQGKLGWLPMVRLVSSWRTGAAERWDMDYSSRMDVAEAIGLNLVDFGDLDYDHYT